MPPTVSPEERKRLAAKEAARNAGVKCTYVAPVPKKKYTPPQLAIVPAPKKITEVLPPSVDENTIAQWASNDAKYHVFQASLNATRPINTKTTNPLPEYLPAQRKYFQGGVIQRTFKRQLSLADDRKYVEYYRHFLAYWKEVQADKPPTPKVGNIQKLPVKMGKLRMPKDKRDISSTIKYFYTETDTLVFETPKLRQNYVDNPANSCYVMDGDTKIYRGIFRDTAPVIVDNICEEQAKIYKPLDREDKWKKIAEGDLSSVKKDKDGIPFLESLDANKLHPVMFCNRPKDHLEPTKYLAEETNQASLELRKNAPVVRVDHRQNVSGGDKTEFNTATGTLRRID